MERVEVLHGGCEENFNNLLSCPASHCHFALTMPAEIIALTYLMGPLCVNPYADVFLCYLSCSLHTVIIDIINKMLKPRPFNVV